MNGADFLCALESELQARGKPFARADVLALIQDDPSPGRWEGEFTEAAGAQAPSRPAYLAPYTRTRHAGPDQKPGRVSPAEPG
jgi:hypothetical protein